MTTTDEQATRDQKALAEELIEAVATALGSHGHGCRLVRGAGCGRGELHCVKPRSVDLGWSTSTGSRTEPSQRRSSAIASQNVPERARPWST